ncbi:Hypothetical protein A7982_05301 [Minicystis rosea]|nr:Hypothetical protein A7982_05301 [Minicystis rosea]
MSRTHRARAGDSLVRDRVSPSRRDDARTHGGLFGFESLALLFVIEERARQRGSFKA